MSNIILLPGNGQEGQLRLDGLQLESAAMRWPVRHNAAIWGTRTVARNFSPIVDAPVVSAEAPVVTTNTVAANVISIASHPRYQYHDQVQTPQPAAEPEPTNTDLDAEAIRRYIDEVA